MKERGACLELWGEMLLEETSKGEGEGRPKGPGQVGLWTVVLEKLPVFPALSSPRPTTQGRPGWDSHSGSPHHCSWCPCGHLEPLLHPL